MCIPIYVVGVYVCTYVCMYLNNNNPISSHCFCALGADFIDSVVLTSSDGVKPLRVLCDSPCSPHQTAVACVTGVTCCVPCPRRWSTWPSGPSRRPTPPSCGYRPACSTPHRSVRDTRAEERLLTLVTRVEKLESLERVNSICERARSFDSSN